MVVEGLFIASGGWWLVVVGEWLVVVVPGCWLLVVVVVVGERKTLTPNLDFLSPVANGK